jgi:3-oxoacyl-[acyl-carrier protein] reductase
MDSLKGKVALVTGGAKGLGQGICLGLAAEGCDIAINYLSSDAAALETKAAVEKLGRRAIAVKADVAKAAEVERLAKTVEKELGPVAILVNNAGMIRPQKVEQITERDWDDVVDINLKSAFLVTQAVLPGMRQRKWGRIVFISSLAAQRGGLVGPHYSAAKAGMLGLAHCYATILAAEGISVNSVAPALIETDMVKSNPNANPGMVPLGRFGQVDEHTAAVVMLAKTGYITGQTLNVNGGMYFS